MMTGLLLASCGEDRIEEQVSRLRMVSVDETVVVLPEKGSVELAFRVRDPDYPLNYQVKFDIIGDGIMLFDKESGDKLARGSVEL